MATNMAIILLFTFPTFPVSINTFYNTENDIQAILKLIGYNKYCQKYCTVQQASSTPPTTNVF